MFGRNRRLWLTPRNRSHVYPCNTYCTCTRLRGNHPLPANQLVSQRGTITLIINCTTLSSFFLGFLFLFCSVWCFNCELRQRVRWLMELHCLRGIALSHTWCFVERVCCSPVVGTVTVVTQMQDK